MSSMLWSVRRELWEHRWIWSVPLLIGAIVVIVFTGVAVTQLAAFGTGANASRLSGLFDLASRMLLITGTVVAFVYCAEALHGERRDRAILFWKTWPVGDGTAVAAKAMVAMIVVPAVTLALLIAAQVIATSRRDRQRHRAACTHGESCCRHSRGDRRDAVDCASLRVDHGRVSMGAPCGTPAGVPPHDAVGLLEPMLGGGAIIGHALFYRGVGRHWPTNLNRIPSLEGRCPGRRLRSFCVLQPSGSAWFSPCCCLHSSRRFAAG